MKANWARMGRIVQVNEVYQLQKEEARRWYERESITPRCGWIVGFRTIWEGLTTPGYSGGGGFDLEPPEFGPPEFNPSNSIRCVLVAFTPYVNAVKVPLDGYVEAPDGEPQTDVPESTREWLRKYSKEWPRDEKGRWAKEA